MNKKEELLSFLNTNIFDPILSSPRVSYELKHDFRLLMNTLKNFSVEGILIYLWTTMANEEIQMIFIHRLTEEGFTDFPIQLEKFKTHFTYEWLRNP